MIYLLSSFQWIITFQIATWRDQNLFVLLPTTSDRSLLATTGDVTAESTGSYSEIITCTNITPFSNAGNCWDLDLLEHPALQLGHRKAYSLGLRSENQAHKLLKQGNRLSARSYFLSHLARIQAQTDSEAVASCHSGVSGCCPHSLAEISVESDPAALAKAFRYSSIPTW